MNLSVGIVGLPNAGKSTLFNALVTKPMAKVGKYPFTTIDKNVGVVNVSDDVLFELAKIEHIEKVTPATITFIDIAGLIKGAHTGEGLGNQFLHHIREVDLILHVVRFFEDENVPHIHSKIDPMDDIEVINDELILADIESLSKKLGKEKVSTDEKVVIQKFISELNKGKLARDVEELSDKEAEIIKPLNLLTFKKQVLVANVSEKDLKNPKKVIKDQPLLSFCAKLEAELAEFPWVEQQRFFKEYGLLKSAKENIITSCYKALDIVTFYTIAKRKEARAWTVKKGTNAVNASGKVHTDFVKHFIKVEATSAEELIKIGSWQKAHERGLIALHGRDYIVEDGDVLEFKIGT